MTKRVLIDKRRSSYETKVGACADYLLGVKYKIIIHKWGISHATVVKWIRDRGCFKLRNNNKNNLK